MEEWRERKMDKEKSGSYTVSNFVRGDTERVSLYTPILYLYGFWANCAWANCKGEFVYAYASGVHTLYDICGRRAYCAFILGGFYEFFYILHGFFGTYRKIL